MQGESMGGNPHVDSTTISTTSMSAFAFTELRAKWGITCCRCCFSLYVAVQGVQNIKLPLLIISVSGIKHPLESHVHYLKWALLWDAFCICTVFKAQRGKKPGRRCPGKLAICRVAGLTVPLSHLRKVTHRVRSATFSMYVLPLQFCRRKHSSVDSLLTHCPNLLDWTTAPIRQQ